eukprot:TRINITY_DN34146_c0_g1_i3.p1 TRINITY_DN34146_c0_g1~~TRINITY_DN34146_c0_g1_i3.p1  ORF type:complete len:512 (+),score=52.89 TRINITY_DN34146_c0_g1_i3:79-1614(+)
MVRWTLSMWIAWLISGTATMNFITNTDDATCFLQTQGVVTPAPEDSASVQQHMLLRSDKSPSAWWVWTPMTAAIAISVMVLRFKSPRPLSTPHMDKLDGQSFHSKLVLAASTLCLICSSVGHSFMVAPYNQHMIQDFRIPRTSLTGAWTAALLASAIWVNIVGQLLDRCDARPVILCGAVMQGASMVSIARSHEKISIMPYFFALRLSSIETVTFASNYCVNCWWVERRGFAMGVMNTIISVQLGLAAVETFLINEVGWRAVALRTGLITSISVAVASCAMSHPSSEGNVNTEKHQSDAQVGAQDSICGLSLREAVQTRMLWVMLFLWLSAGVPWAGLNFLLGALLAQAGHKQEDAVYVYISMSVVVSFSSIFVGWVIQCLSSSTKHFSLICMNGACLLALIAASLLSVLPPKLSLILFGCSMGIFVGALDTVQGTVVADVFGERHLGEVTAFLTTFQQVAAACGPTVFSYVVTFGVPFSKILLFFGVCNATGMVLVAMLSMPQMSGTVPM